MTPEEVLAIKPRVLTQRQRAHYWSGGYTSIFAVQQEEDWSKNGKVAAGGMM